MLGKPEKYDEYMALVAMVFVSSRDAFITAIYKLPYATKELDKLEVLKRSKKGMTESQARHQQSLHSLVKNCKQDVMDMWDMTHRDTSIIDALGYDPAEVWQLLTNRKYNTYRPDLTSGTHYRDALEVIRNYVGVKYQ